MFSLLSPNITVLSIPLGTFSRDGNCSVLSLLFNLQSANFQTFSLELNFKTLNILYYTVYVILNIFINELKMSETVLLVSVQDKCCGHLFLKQSCLLS